MVEIDRLLCDLCGTCVSVCETEALLLHEFFLQVKKENCINCGNCLQACPAKAIKVTDAQI